MGRVVKKLPRIVAHRGLAGRFPENTLRAFAECLPYSHMFEFDVWFSKDRHLVVSHDESLVRMTGTPGDVREFTLAQLRALEVTMRGKQGDDLREKIPTLREIVTLVAQVPVHMNIEIKSQPETNRIQAGLLDAVAHLVRDTGCEQNTLISSFDHHFVDELVAHGFKTPRRLLLGFAGKTYLTLLHGVRHVVDYVRRFSVEGVNIDKNFLSERLVCALQETGMLVGVYSVDTIDEMERYVAWGVDDIYTKNPDVLHKYLTTHHNMRPLEIFV